MALPYTFNLFKAKFIGADGSLGYRKDKDYYILILNHGWFFKLVNGWQLEIKRIDGTGWCPYTNTETFSANWKITKSIVHKIKEVK